MDKSQNPFLNTIRLRVKTAPIIVILVILVHFFSFFMPWMSGLGLISKAVLTALPLISFAYYLNKYHFGPEEKQVSELILASDDCWQVTTKNGTCYPADLGKVLFIHPLLTIITLSFNQSKKDFIFTPENIDTELFRRLRVRLKYKVV